MIEIGACTPVCEEDGRWVDQYLREVSRLGVYFAVYLDRCGADITHKMTRHSHCLGWVVQIDPSTEYQESCRQELMNVLKSKGFKLSILWDIDETWERYTPQKLMGLYEYRGFDNAYVHWLNLWGADTRYVRLDNPSNPYRIKIHRLDTGVDWTWRGGVTVDPYPTRKGEPEFKVHSFKSDLVCLHHGLKTRELREQHKARWDRIYGHHLGSNPYTYWDYLLDEEKNPPQLGVNVYE